MPQRPNTMEDFWRNVDVRGEDDCWEWLGWKDKDGYGSFRLHNRNKRSHRLALSAVQDVPLGKVVCHKCDNPSCCNPAHLFIGTQADNMRDMDKKGRRKSRGRSGEHNHKSKLSECEVHFIKHSDIKQQELAKIFDVTPVTISHIKLGKTWGHVA